MKIIRLEAENIKKITAIDITPKQDLIQITGENGSGKSSVLDSILWALAGTTKVQKMPIRKGKTTARIKLDMGSVVVTRNFDGNGTSTLRVESDKGAKFGTPQKMLDDLIGSLSFDPLEFVRLDPKEQFSSLCRLSKINIDFEAIEEKNRVDYEVRTNINRNIRALRQQMENYGAVTEDLPDKPIDISQLAKKMAEASERNSQIDLRRQRQQDQLRQQTQKVVTLRATIQQKLELAADLRKEADAAEAEAKKMQLEESALTEQIKQTKAKGEEKKEDERIDVAGLQAEIKAAQKTNSEIERRKELARIVAQLKQEEDQAEKLSEAMKDRDRAKVAALAKAKMPLPGLALGDRCVLYNDVPLEQASTAEQLRISASIAMAANNRLRVMLIKDGSLLDEKGLKLLAELGRQNDYQIWMEKVARPSDKIGIVMEDGHVAMENGEKKVSA
jgi:DNA repair exonuclease SbcCD ATPase subunit